MPKQLSRYNSFRRDFNDSAKLKRLADVRREHWLRFIDLSIGVEEISERNPPSESRHAPPRDRLVNTGNCFGDLAKLETTTKSGKQRPHWSSCSTYFNSKLNKKIQKKLTRNKLHLQKAKEI
jgi:hypothetical protein